MLFRSQLTAIRGNLEHIVLGRVNGSAVYQLSLIHISFKPGEITPEEANRLGVEFAKRFTKGNHAFVVDVYKRQPLF